MEDQSFRYDIESLAKDMDVDLVTVSTLYSEYFHEMKINIQECKTLTGNEEWDKLERVVHNIKGISTSLNISDIYAVSQKLDIDLKSGKYSTADSDINQIVDLFYACENDIKEFFKEQSINV